MPRDDVERVAAVLAALKRLRARDAGPLSQGLSPANARACLDLACRAITGPGLLAELATPGERPKRLGLIAAYGVFTAPLEWVCLYVAAGCAVTIKAPSSDPAFLAAVAEDLRAEKLKVECETDTGKLGRMDAIVSFGTDATVAEIARTWPDSLQVGFGHRFSVAVVHEPTPLAAPVRRALAVALARDAALYDGQGCMAPTAVFTTGDPDVLADALSDALGSIEAALPRGRVPPEVGPIWRQRLMLARVKGRVKEGPRWGVVALPVGLFTPAALPRLLEVHPIDRLEALGGVLDPWRGHLSTVGTNLVTAEGQLPAGPQWLRWFSRVTPLGSMQTPPFPRRHDGLAMLGCVLRPRLA